jgi:hypothetical protein
MHALLRGWCLDHCDVAEVRAIDGADIRDKAALLDRLAHALAFPDYFGCNRDAFEECLRVAAATPGGSRNHLVLK